MGGWNELDFFIFLIFVINLVQGMNRGATKEIIALMCLCFSIIVTIKFTVTLTGFLDKSPLIADVVNTPAIQNFMVAIFDQKITADILKQLNFCIALLLCFTGAYSITAAGLSVSGFVEVFSFPFATLNRKVGAILGCTRGYVIVLIFLVCAIHMYRDSNLPGKDWIANSFFADLFSNSAKKFNQLIIDQNPDRYREIFEDQGKFGAGDVTKILDGGKNQDVQQFESLLQQGAPAGGSTQTPDTSGSISGDLKDHNGPAPSGVSP